MKHDVRTVHDAVADLLVNDAQRQEWEKDPRGYAERHLAGKDEAAMVAGLDAGRLAETASVLANKTAAGEAYRQRQAERPRNSSPPTRPSESGRRSTRRPRARSGPPLVGLAYRPGLFRRFLPHLELVEVWEHTVDHFVDGGEEAVRAMGVFADGAPLALHSLDLSVGSSPDRDDRDRLKRIGMLVASAGVTEISDHLGYSRSGGRSLGHFLPIWRVQGALEVASAKIDYLQDALGVRLALENIALPFDPGGEMTTAEFLNELCSRTGCGVHLDITNLTINAANAFCDAAAELSTLQLDSVLSVHLAGGIEVDGVMQDAHAFPVPASDIEWIERLVPHMPNCRTIVIERDGRHGAVEEVADDLRRVQEAVTAATSAPVRLSPSEARVNAH